MKCGAQGRFANAKNILPHYGRFLLQREEAEKIVAGMSEQVGRWYNFARLSGGRPPVASGQF
jgi:serine/threonine-protein kinase HipA